MLGIVTGAGGLNLTPTPTYADNTNAGTATASYSFAGDANHGGSSDSDTFTIDKATSTTTVTCPVGPYTYTGSAQTPCSATVTGAGGLNLTPTPSYTDNTDAGTATASYTFDGDANHFGSNDDDTFTIDKADADCAVTGYSVTYDGTANTATGTCTGVLDEVLTGLDLSGTTHTDAGTYTDTWTFTDVTGNYNDQGGHRQRFDRQGGLDGHGRLPRRASPSTARRRSPAPRTVTGAGGLDESLDVRYADNTDAGTASASASYAGDANHEADIGLGDVRDREGSLDHRRDLPDERHLHRVCAHAVLGDRHRGRWPGRERRSRSTRNNTDAGTANASATYAGDANHEGSSDATTFAIDKADSVVGITCPTSVTYTAVRPGAVHRHGDGRRRPHRDPDGDLHRQRRRRHRPCERQLRRRCQPQAELELDDVRDRSGQPDRRLHGGRQDLRCDRGRDDHRLQRQRRPR